MSLNVIRRVPYVRLGKSGLKVSRIILGCMSYGTPEWQKWVLGEEEGIAQIKFAYENGIQTFDTADVYSNGASEIILGKAIKQLNLPREEIVIMTKLHFPVSSNPGELLWGSQDSDSLGYVNQYGQSRKHIFDSVQKSLKRLQLDYIDVLQCSSPVSLIFALFGNRRSSAPLMPHFFFSPAGHRFDYNTPVEEVMQALHDVVQKGWVHYIGMSSCWAYQFHQMQNYAINNRLTPFISMQNQYSLVYREEEREMMPTLRHFGVGSIPWSPLARGALTRPLGERTTRADNDSWHDVYLKEPSNQDIVKRVEELAKKRNLSMAQISLAWTLSKEVVTAPIIGSTSLDKLKELIDTIDVKLSEEEIKHLEEPYKPMPVIGHT